MQNYDLKIKKRNNKKNILVNIGSILDKSYLKNMDFNNNIIIYCEVYGYEGKTNIISAVIDLYNTIKLNDVLIINIPKNKGAKSYFNIIQEILFDNIELYTELRTHVIKIIKINNKFIQVPEKYSNSWYFNEIVFGYKFLFKTKMGMFSYKKLDEGSKFIVEVFKNEKIDLKNGKILDFGCGYGAIGIPISFLFNQCKITCLDINATCVEHANINAQLNNLNNLDFIVSNGCIEIPKEVKYDIILSHFPMHIDNNSKKRILEEFYEHLTYNGLVFLIMLDKYCFSKLYGNKFIEVKKLISTGNTPYCVYILSKNNNLSKSI
jgi:16S rRNA (guanine1207-N2)-methyltransferase